MNEPMMRAIASHLIGQVMVVDSTFRADADNVNNLTRALLEVRRTPYQVQYPALIGMTLVPPDPENSDPGASHFTYNFEDRAGKARLGSSLKTMPPRVDVKVEEVPPIAFRDIDISFGFDVQELRAAAMAKRALPKAKAEAARKAIAERHDDIILLADGTSDFENLRGLFKLLNTTSHTVANGVAGTKGWETKTGMEIVNDLHAICNAVTTGTNGVENPDTVVLPLTLWTIAATTRVGDGIEDTALDLFIKQRKKLNPSFTEVLVSVKLETAGSGGVRRMVAYSRDPDKVARVDSVEFEMFPPQLVGYETVTMCHARTAGVYSPFPKSVAYGDFTT
jgi:hypothetical protein